MEEKVRAEEVEIIGRPHVTVIGKTEVVLTDVRIPFGSLVSLWIKVAIAAIPAAIILAFIGVALSSVIVGMLDH
jgi:hypothetical protein